MLWKRKFKRERERKREKKGEKGRKIEKERAYGVCERV